MILLQCNTVAVTVTSILLQLYCCSDHWSIILLQSNTVAVTVTGILLQWLLQLYCCSDYCSIILLQSNTIAQWYNVKMFILSAGCTWPAVLLVNRRHLYWYNIMFNIKSVQFKYNNPHAIFPQLNYYICRPVNWIFIYTIFETKTCNSNKNNLMQHLPDD